MNSKIKVLGLVAAMIAVVYTLLPNGVVQQKINDYSEEYTEMFASNKLDLGITAEELKSKYNDSWLYSDPNIIKVESRPEEFKIISGAELVFWYDLDNNAQIIASVNSEGKIFRLVIYSDEYGSFTKLDATCEKTLYVIGKLSCLDSLGLWKFLKYTIDGTYVTITDCAVTKSVHDIFGKQTLMISIFPLLHQ